MEKALLYVGIGVLEVIGVGLLVRFWPGARRYGKYWKTLRQCHTGGHRFHAGRNPPGGEKG
ncbi:hypothetical protein B5E80_18080 [Flavonifractor sp. An135]|nr:hypothetical protein B5E80_18080 [Flavonifractor sp. An135]